MNDEQNPAARGSSFIIHCSYFKNYRHARAAAHIQNLCRRIPVDADLDQPRASENGKGFLRFAFRAALRE